MDNQRKKQVKEYLSKFSVEFTLNHKIRTGEIIEFSLLTDSQFKEAWGLLEKFSTLKLTEDSDGFYKSEHFFRTSIK